MQDLLLDGQSNVCYSVCRHGLPESMFLKAPRNSFEALKSPVLAEDPR